MVSSRQTRCFFPTLLQLRPALSRQSSIKAWGPGRSVLVSSRGSQTPYSPCNICNNRCPSPITSRRGWRTRVVPKRSDELTL